MKNPKITPGQWSYKKNLSRNKWFVASSETDICEMNFLYDSQEANAQAISAVPNLLDDAIRKYNWMIRLKFTHPHLVPDEEIEQTYQALKKAGCE